MFATEKYSIETVNNLIGLIRGESISFSDSKDIELFMELVVEQKLFMCFSDELRKFISTELLDVFNNYYESYIRTYEAQVIVMKQIVDTCAELNIIPYFIKGIVLSEIIYNNPYRRISNDIDILFREDDISKAFKALIDNGFIDILKQLNGCKVYFPFNTMYHHDLILKKEIDVYKGRRINNKFIDDSKSVYVEIKRATSGIRSPKITSIFLNNRQQVNLNDCCFFTLDIEHTLLQLFLNAYGNTETIYGVCEVNCIRDYVDLYNKK